MSASCFSFLFRATTRSILIHFRVKTLILARLQRKNARTALIEKIKANEENEKIPVSPQYLKQGTFFTLTYLCVQMIFQRNLLTTILKGLTLA